MLDLRGAAGDRTGIVRTPNCKASPATIPMAAMDVDRRPAVTVASAIADRTGIASTRMVSSNGTASFMSRESPPTAATRPKGNGRMASSTPGRTMADTSR